MARFSICLLALVLVTAGCQAPIADADGNATTTGTAASGELQRDDGNGTTVSVPDIRVRNGSLELDPGRVFARVQTVAGTNVTAPETVRVYESSEAFYGDTTDREPTVPPFWRLAGLESGAVNGSELEIQKNGYVKGTGEVVVYLSPNTTLADERLLLAHEFTHYIQIQQNRRTDLNEAFDRGTTQMSYLSRAVVEGAAVFTADAYVREYAPDAKRNSPWYDEIQASYPVGHVARLQNGRYVHGHEYVTARLDSPTELPAVYENPPRTSEQLLHGLAPGVEPATPLSVNTTTSEKWVPSGTDTMGEAFLRYALASDVGTARAARAAAGWGNDSLHIFRPTDGGTAGYVWVLDWDDPANATEFEQAIRAAFDARGSASSGLWTLSDVSARASIAEIDAETTAVVFGPKAFVSSTALEATGENVTIHVE